MPGGPHRVKCSARIPCASAAACPTSVRFRYFRSSPMARRRKPASFRRNNPNWRVTTSTHSPRRKVAQALFRVRPRGGGGGGAGGVRAVGGKGEGDTGEGCRRSGTG